MTRAPIDTAAILDTVDLRSLVESRGVALKRSPQGWVGRCPFHLERTASFTLFTRPRPGHGHCFGCGWHGDAIGFVMSADHVGFLDAVRMLGGEVLPRPDPAAAERRAREREREEARAARRAQVKRQHLSVLYGAAAPAAGTLVEAYLASRGITAEALGGLPPVLRFAMLDYVAPGAEADDPPIDFGPMPAMLAPLDGPDGTLAGLHVTWLAPDGSGKAELFHPQTGEELPAKKMYGQAWGSAIRLTEGGAAMMAGEGIETSLTVLAQLRRADRDAAVWALGSLGNFAGAGIGEGPRIPGTLRLVRGRRVWRHYPSPMPDPKRAGWGPPRGTRRFTWLGDADGRDPRHGELLVDRGLARLRAARVDASVRWAAPGMDFNDMARGAA